ncbi:hypothetical protein AAE02nite_43860 [Adhaeribacter aerolatus]|uniref:SMP-30/Gluconolactonase/LRE-like region domain-containing protein n=1 Tax=Adhaeribacter aerolatus TaxID=670289 RepID=A0A512B455_9BACT|nr:SdiA-regulated domain-containing protein [Adhaeribacter aerolatus]GEO06722.1 hypothetical protein AAE02nite_43860 [Adhaeribacter aerolatus]
MKTFNIFWLALILALGLFSCDSSRTDKPKKKNKEDNNQATSTGEVKILEKWEMPNMLREVSGIAYLDENHFACVQDEAGVVFIYNIAKNRIESEVDFGASGDYEGIALVNDIAYVVRSDGKIFEINDITSGSPHIKEYATHLTVKNNVEGITYDRKNNRLLLAIKGDESDDADFKGIYAFDLNAKKLSKTPVYKIDLNDSVFADSKAKKLGSRMQPSEIAVHPTTGDIYVLEGTNPQLLVLDDQGSIKHRYNINGTGFSQPEGMTFNPAGDLFISNEGKKEKGNILKVQIN